MTTITVYSGISYLTAIEGISWRNQDYTANKIVKCVKGDKINGTFDIMLKGRQHTFSEQNKADFLAILYQALANSIGEHIGGEFTLVPIPNSAVTAADGQQFRTLALARELAVRLGARADAVPALVWRQALSAARRGGPRDPDVLYENLSVVQVPRRQIVLFDDVMTSGGHIVACYRRLRDAGNAPIATLVVGRSTREQKEKMIAWSQEALPVQEQPTLWDF